MRACRLDTDARHNQSRSASCVSTELRHQSPRDSKRCNLAVPMSSRRHVQRYPHLVGVSPPRHARQRAHSSMWFLTIGVVAAALVLGWIMIGSPWIARSTPAQDRFTSLDVPTVRSVTPADGPGRGGTKVLVRGTRFTAATAVLVGARSARVVDVRNADA